MSRPLRKRMRSPGFSPHSSAGLSEKETRAAEKSNVNHRLKLDPSTTSPANKVHRTDGRNGERWWLMWFCQSSSWCPTKPVNIWTQAPCWIALHKETILSKQPWWNLLLLRRTHHFLICHPAASSQDWHLFSAFLNRFLDFILRSLLFPGNNNVALRSRWETCYPPPLSPVQPP